jgi:hypothetical protein
MPQKPSCIIALHNNTDEEYSVKSYTQNGDRRSDAKAVYADSLQDTDDMILTIDSILFQKIAKNRYNSILQDNINARRDGSLSVYCGERNIRYINIETQHGKVEQYQQMLETLCVILVPSKQKSFPQDGKDSQ